MYEALTEEANHLGNLSRLSYPLQDCFPSLNLFKLLQGYSLFFDVVQDDFVRMVPGHTVFTRIFAGPKSKAMRRVM
jgi:hypothetical protein